MALVDFWSRFRTGQQNDTTLQALLNKQFRDQLIAREEFAKGVKQSLLQSEVPRQRIISQFMEKGVVPPEKAEELQHRFIREGDNWGFKIFMNDEDAASLTNPLQEFQLRSQPSPKVIGRNLIAVDIPGRNHANYGDIYGSSDWDRAFSPLNADASGVGVGESFMWGLESELNKPGGNNIQGLHHNLSPHEFHKLGGFAGLSGHFLGPLAHLPNVGRILGAEPGVTVPLGEGAFRGVGQVDMLNALPSPVHQLAGMAGNSLGHVLTTWPFRAAWSSHPGDLLGRVYAPAIGTQFGFQEKLPGDVFWKAVPPGVAMAGLVSGSVNLGGLLDTEEGPRPAGYQANYANTDDRRKTNNYLLSLLALPTGGGYVRTLPWEQFTQERPGVSQQDYDDYNLMRRNLADETERTDDFSTAFGPILMSGTMENLEGVPELNVGGGRITLPGAMAGAATTGGLLYAMRPRR